MNQKPKIVRQEVNGVVLLDKHPDISSNHALQSVRRLLQAKKAGHTGTLDPFATGLMVLCFGEATKYSEGMFAADKAYCAEVQLGWETDTADCTGKEITARQEPSVTQEQLQLAIQQFKGQQEQIPPMFSALKFQGKPLYEYARQGVEIERKARTIQVYEIEAGLLKQNRFEMKVRCSKGTYIRSLAQDIGRYLGCGAHLSALRRTETAGFDITQTWTLERLTKAENPHSALLPIDSLIEQLPACTVTDEQKTALQRGQVVLFEGEPQGILRLYDADHHFIGTGLLEKGTLRPQRLLAIKDKT